jgi:hypothetical protein
MKTIINKILPFSLALTSLFFILVESQFKNLTESVSASWQIYFHDPETPIMEGIINFHDKAMCSITFIVFAVGYALFRCVVLFENKNDNRLSEKLIQSGATLPALVTLSLGVPFISLLEGAKGNASQGAIVKIVTQDPLFLENISFSGFLPELKGFLVSNSAFLVPFFYFGFHFYVYFSSKPKPPSDPDSGSEGVVLDIVWTRTAEDYSGDSASSDPESGSEGVVLGSVEARTADLLDYSGDSASSGSDLVSLNYLREEANSFNPSPRFPYASEALGEEEKSSTLDLSDYLNHSDSSSGDFESNPYLWEDKLCAILDELSPERRSSLIRELLENSDSMVQVTMLSELVESYRSSPIYLSYRDCLENLSDAFTFCNNFGKNNLFLDDEVLFVETFTDSFLIVPNLF